MTQQEIKEELIINGNSNLESVVENITNKFKK